MAMSSTSPLGKKRPAVESALGETPETNGLAQTRPSPKRRKQIRSQLFEPTDSHGMTPSAGTSIAETDAASASVTATIAEAVTPLTETSSTPRKCQPRAKRYLCTFPNCGKAFDRPVRLQTHQNTHTGERPHTCPESGCGKSFYKPEHLNRHVKEKHGDARFECTYDVRNEFSGEMGPCGRVFESSIKLKRHVAMHEEKEETTCSWESCGMVFRKQETLQRHIKKDHLREDSYICARETVEGGMCGQSFPTRGQLKGHEAREHDAPKYVCDICTSAMVQHAEEEMPILNDLDPEFLPTEADLQAADDAIDSSMFDGLSLEDANPTTIRFPGDVVGFATFHDLQRHNKFAHPPICMQCGKKCKSNKDLSAHVEIEHPPDGTVPAARPGPAKKYLCPYDGCVRSTPPNGFTKKGNMDVHIKSAHAKERGFVCGEFDLSGNEKVDGWNASGCGSAFSTKQSLVSHVRTRHLGLPAATSVKTGLLNKDRKRRGKAQVEHVETDMNPVQEAPSTALSMLTGAGYEQLRPHGCLLSGGPRGCQMRFAKEYDLGTHMELTHGWNVDDINDALAAGVDVQGGHRMGMQASGFEPQMAM